MLHHWSGRRVVLLHNRSGNNWCLLHNWRRLLDSNHRLAGHKELCRRRRGKVAGLHGRLSGHNWLGCLIGDLSRCWCGCGCSWSTVALASALNREATQRDRWLNRLNLGEGLLLVRLLLGQWLATQILDGRRRQVTVVQETDIRPGMPQSHAGECNGDDDKRNGFLPQSKHRKKKMKNNDDAIGKQRWTTMCG